MKKSSFAAMILGTISIVFFGLGMCMALQPEWNLFNQGVVIGCIGLVFGLITILVWRKMENLPAIKITGKGLLIILLSITGSLGLGIGMCNAMVWGNLILGIGIGLCGILVLLSLFPIWKGIK
ncbi:hypothetical protein [Anaerorhabdus sp.]|uniref:hypothetical protein n=1 Tax=Anaerorhabdus sp. TaxID=1872524 RepID=UPI002B1E9C9E|nr:hypothetical protein [Anaerorhabdus sp.]MEA4873889.1 hypothetical protein [Anaerorhabdus sp.]